VDFDFRLNPSDSTRINLGIGKFELREKLSLRATFDKRLISNIAEVAIAKGEHELSSESNHFHVRFPLPQSLKVCRQSVRESRIKISHAINIEVELKDEEGQAMQVRPLARTQDDCLAAALADNTQIALSFPFELFFPPSITFDEAGNGCFDRVRPAPIRHGETLPAAPPAFGKHYQDELYTQDDLSIDFLGAFRDPRMPQQIDRREGSEAGSFLTGDTVERVDPPDMTPSYESAIQVPESFIDRNSSLPAYEIIDSDRSDMNLNPREQVQIGIPQPAVCRSRRVD